MTCGTAGTCTILIDFGSLIYVTKHLPLTTTLEKHFSDEGTCVCVWGGGYSNNV